MGVTKQYLRYVPAGKCNVICNPDCNISFVTLEDRKARYAAVGGAEDVIVWDLRLSRKVRKIEGEKHSVTHLCVSDSAKQIAVGYTDGTVKTFNLDSEENEHIFSGHRSPISALQYNNKGYYLATGSKDTDVVVWDIVAGSGLHRLIGHKGIITAIQFMTFQDIVITSSKDTFVKLWDLTTGHCFHTITDHIMEVWSILLMENDSYLVTSSCDNELRVYKLKENSVAVDDTDRLRKLMGDDTSCDTPLCCEKAGSILRQGRGRVTLLSSDSEKKIFCSSGNDRTLELFSFKSEEEAVKKFRKKQKKLKHKIQHSENGNNELEQLLEEMEKSSPTSLKYVLNRLPVIRTQEKIKSVDASSTADGKITIAVSLSNNTIEVHSMPDINSKEAILTTTVSNPGHTSDIKIVTFSSDNTTVVSSSPTSIKIWNLDTLSCLRTIDTEYTMSMCFVPGDRHLLVGKKDGKLLIVDIASADVIESIDAHLDEVRSISVLPDKAGCVTGSADKTVKFWQFTNVKSASFDVFSLLHTRTLKLDESVFCLCVSPDSNLIAVSLADTTVKIFFMDTLKFFISLYGHKLPVTCMDISYDSSLIITGSVDRNVKIWGLDYGDCHKSIFAHEDSITAISFVPHTHYFFTCGKDGSIKQWDADNFERITTLQGHIGEAWCLAVSPNGEFVVSCGQDRVMRLYERSMEPIVLEDEREVEREEEDSTALATGSDSVVLGHAPLSLPSKKVVSAEKAAELLLECLDVIKKYEEEKNASNQAPQLPLIMTAFNAKNCNEYLLAVLNKIRSSELEETLLLLPLSSVQELFNLCLIILKESRSDIEVVVKVVVFLVKLNHKPIVSNTEMASLMKHLSRKSTKKVTELRDLIGINYHSLLLLQHRKEVKEGAKMFEDALAAKSQKEARKRKRDALVKTALLKI